MLHLFPDHVTMSPLCQTWSHHWLSGLLDDSIVIEGEEGQPNLSVVCKNFVIFN